MRVSKEIFMIKFKYEINLRKKEFLKFCTLKDFNYRGYLTEQDFYDVLMNFTAYLSDKEIFELIDNTISNGKIKYTEIVNFPAYENDLLYKDNYLQHLNLNRNSKDIKLLETSIRKILSEKDYLNPIQNYQHSANEENFKIYIGKRIFDFLLKSAPKGLESGFIKDIIRQYDFDDDGFYTIGELNNLLLHCNISLDILDLRFLFEKGFTINEFARIKIEDIENYIITYSRHNYKGSLLKDDFYSKYENEDKQEAEKLILNNKVVTIIEDCLKNLGKDFLVNYFKSHYEIKDSEMINIDGNKSLQKIAFLDSLWLEIGLKNLGYSEIPSSEMGNFKYYLIKNRLTDLGSQTLSSLKINFLDFLDHMISKLNIDSFILKQDFSHINYNDNNTNNVDIKDSMICKSEIITDRTTKLLFKDIELIFLEKILKSKNEILDKSSKDQSSKKEEKIKFKYVVDEIKFRKDLISNFGFIDHDIMNDFTKYLSKDLEKKSVVYGDNSFNSLDLDNNDKLFNKYKTLNNDFQIGEIETKKWVKLCYNMTFLGMIEKSEELGLILDIEDKIYLSKISEKIKKKIYPSLFHKNYINSRVNKSKKNKSNKDLIKQKDNNGVKIDVIKYLENSKKNDMIINSNENNIRNNTSFNIDNIKENLSKNLEEQDSLKFKKSRINANEDFLKMSKQSIPMYEIKGNVDSNIAIPLIHNTCVNYLVKTYNISSNINNKISEEIMSKLSICKLFKDLILNKCKDLITYDKILDRIKLDEFSHFMIKNNINKEIVDFLHFYMMKRKQNQSQSQSK